MNILLIVIILIYNIGIVIYVLYIFCTPDKETEKGEDVTIIEVEYDDSIVGKSKFKIPNSTPLTAKSTPLDATAEKGDDKPEMPATFASQTDEKPSAKVADENLDNAFEDVRAETSPTSYADADDDYDGVPNDEFATGSTIEEIGESVETAANPNATPQQQERAAKVFVEMEGSELYDKLMANSTKWRDRIRALTDSYLGSATDNGTTKSSRGRKEFKPPTTLDEFNIRDYV
ncbi:MAG: conjugal transfer protein TraD [Rikenellaceae bacterium]